MDGGDPLHRLSTISTRSSTLNIGSLPRAVPTATTTLSKSRAVRRTRSRWPFVTGSKKPGRRPASPRYLSSPHLLSIRPHQSRAVASSSPAGPLAARAPVEGQAVVADALLPGASEGAYCLRKRTLVEVLSHHHAALREEGSFGEQGEQGS